MYLKVGMPEADKYEVIDILTGQRIPLVQSADDKTGEFSCYLIDFDKKDLIWDENKDAVLFRFKGNIKLLKKEVT